MKSNARIFPKTLSDWWAFIVVIFLVTYIGLIELFVMLPEIYKEASYMIQTIAGFVIYANVAYCFVMVLLNDSTTSGIVLPALLQPGWKYCSVCEANSPPRAFHCPTCDVCILKRDHHCTFSGSCVGYKNYRYYISFLFFLSVGAVYCNYLNFRYVLIVFDGFGLTQLFIVILPMLAFLCGLTDLYMFFISFTITVSLFGSLYLVALFSYHIGNVYFGQTTHERSYNIRTYDNGWKTNFSDVFGRFPLTLFCPWLKSNIPIESAFGENTRAKVL